MVCDSWHQQQHSVSGCVAGTKFVAADFNTLVLSLKCRQGFKAEDVPHDESDLPGLLAANRSHAGRAAGIIRQPAGPQPDGCEGLLCWVCFILPALNLWWTNYDIESPSQ
jgi:hypothetical protein